MEHMLLKHAQLTKQYQIDIKIREKSFVVHDCKYAYLPVAGQLAVYPLGSKEWRGFTSLTGILDKVVWKEDEDKSIYSFEIITIQPDDVPKYKVPEYDSKTMTPREYLRSVIKNYLLYVCIEYEK